jgi:hypothetical protein
LPAKRVLADAAPARRQWFRWGERVKAVQPKPRVAECRRRPGVPLPGLGESGGGVVVSADAGKGAPKGGQVGGEEVGLLRRERREA